MTGGGVNWGGAAFDPVNQILYANTSYYAVHIIKLIPQPAADRVKAVPGREFAPQRGAPFALTREVAIGAAVQQAAMGRGGRGQSEGG